jgi:hypothetical protein
MVDVNTPLDKSAACMAASIIPFFARLMLLAHMILIDQIQIHIWHYIEHPNEVLENSIDNAHEQQKLTEAYNAQYSDRRQQNVSYKVNYLVYYCEQVQILQQQYQ